MPGNVHLERGVDVLGDHILVVREVQKTVIVLQNRAGTGSENGYLAFQEDPWVREKAVICCAN
jgi:hypothetical protein